MSGPETGKYWIQHSYYHSMKLGADNVDSDEPTVPVISYGYYNFFYVTKVEDGKYTIALQGNERTRYIQAHENRMVVAKKDAPPSYWVISGAKNGPYVIEAPSPTGTTKVWTVRGGDPYAKKPVSLNIIDIPMSGQEFDFIRLEE